jgi:uncharacterized protein YggE
MDRGKIWFWGLLDFLIAVSVILILFVCIPAVSNWGDSFWPSRTINVSSEGKTTATPDLAIVSFSVVSQGSNPKTLETTNNSKMSDVMKFVKSQGIDDKDITTTAYDLSPNYKYDQNSNLSYITGYTFTQTLSLKIHDLSKVGDIISGLTPLGVNQIGGINFTFNNPDDFIKVARADAITKAEAKAKEMASEAGILLGKIVNIGENVVYQPYNIQNTGVKMMSSVAQSSAPTIAPGSQDITDNVSITYQLN